MNFAKAVLAVIVVIVFAGIFFPEEYPQEDKGFSTTANAHLSVLTDVTIDSIHTKGEIESFYAGHLQGSEKKVYVLIPGSCHPRTGETVMATAHNLITEVPTYVMSTQDPMCDDDDDNDYEKSPVQIAGAL